MSWIKSKNGLLVNVENIKCIGMEKEGHYYVVSADVADEQTYWLTERITAEEDAKDLMARIERWLEKGAPGVFQV